MSSVEITRGVSRTTANRCAASGYTFVSVCESSSPTKTSPTLYRPGSTGLIDHGTAGGCGPRYLNAQESWQGPSSGTPREPSQEGAVASFGGEADARVS